MSESHLLGPKLTPPRGGLLRLQDAIGKRSRRHFHTRTWVAAGVTAGFVTVSLVFVLHGAIRQHRMDVMVQQALTAEPQTHFDNAAYQELPSSNPDVKILMIGSLPDSQTASPVKLPDRG